MMRSKKIVAALGLIFVSFSVSTIGQQSEGRLRRPFAGIREKIRNRPGMQRPPQEGQPEPPQLDRDGDGFVSEDEIAAVVVESFDNLKNNDPQRFEMVMKRFDRNQNGILDKDEALEAHAEHQKRMQENPGMQQPGRPGGDMGISRPSVPAVPDDMGLLKGVTIEGFVPPAK